MEFIEETKLPFDKIEELLKIYSDMERILQYDGKFKSFEERLLELELFYDRKTEIIEKGLKNLNEQFIAHKENFNRAYSYIKAEFVFIKDMIATLEKKNTEKNEKDVEAKEEKKVDNSDLLVDYEKFIFDGGNIPNENGKLLAG